MSNRYKSGLAFFLSLTILVSCGTKPVELTCNRLEIASVPLNNLAVNVYIDGTPSMEGYVNVASSRYARTLDNLFNLLEQRTPLTLTGESDNKPAINYLRLGRNAGELAQPLSGSQHLRSVNAEFYNGSSFPALEVTEIDAAITATEPEELTIIVTDLYQADQYVNQVVSDIEERLSSIPQGAVGVIGLRSEFNGTVYTEALSGASSFQYSNSTPSHPFYVLLIGRVDEVSFYMNALKERSEESGFNDGMELVLFSPERIHKTAPIFRKQESLSEAEPAVRVPTTKMAYGRNVRINLNDEVQPVVLKSKNESTEIPFNIAVESIENVFHPSTLNAELIRNHQSFDHSDKEFAPRPNSDLDKALQITNPSLNTEAVSFNLTIDPTSIRPPGIYFYTLDAVVNPSSNSDNSLTQTWAAWSSDSADPESNTDGSKTHNLDNLLEGLAEMTLAKIRQKNISLGQYCYLIQSS